MPHCFFISDSNLSAGNYKSNWTGLHQANHVHAQQLEKLCGKFTE